MSIVRENMLTRLGYTPYCGNDIARHLPKGCDNPRTFFNGKQMECPRCGWQSEFEPEFIEQYKSAQKELTEKQ